MQSQTSMICSSKCCAPQNNKPCHPRIDLAQQGESKESKLGHLMQFGSKNTDG